MLNILSSDNIKKKIFHLNTQLYNKFIIEIKIFSNHKIMKKIRTTQIRDKKRKNTCRFSLNINKKDENIFI